jgi:YesN/AraC family two-component response regulator
MKFKKAVGISIVEYVNKLRVKVACMLLKDTALPTFDIMERVGFNDVSYWGRTFKELMGLTPSEYRKAHKPAS